MKWAALEPGADNIAVNALPAGLIDTALTRHEDRYSQAIREAGTCPAAIWGRLSARLSGC